jgi:acetyl esterase/lipase
MTRAVLATLMLCIAPTLAAQPGRPLPGPAPTLRDVAYARSDATTGQGHLLDLYLPPRAAGPSPVVIFTRGSAWFADNGRQDAQGLAAVLHESGYAVAGVAIRSSRQAKFPAQLHDIKAAVRWLRANAAKHRLDPDRIAILGESSGGWTAAMAAVTGDVPDLEGTEGTTGLSSAVQAAVAFYPPTDFLQMDAWALRPCDPAAAVGRGAFCHDAPSSPESQLVGCAIQTCADAVQRANPIRYVSRADPPIMIVHGGSDPLVPHAQGELLYQALNKACRDAVFISMPVAGHGVWHRMMSDTALAAAATRRSTTSAGCIAENPKPYTPTWGTIVEFLDRSMRVRR